MGTFQTGAARCVLTLMRSRIDGTCSSTSTIFFFDSASHSNLPPYVCFF